MKAISGESCESAWLEAAEFLVKEEDKTAFNLIVEIRHPATRSPGDLKIRQTVDAFLRSKSARPVATVAGTIFPASEYKLHGSRGVYEVYPKEVYPEIKDTWGTYAHRLVHCPADNPEGFINPLEIMVDKMKNQLSNGKRMKSCYEISLSDSGIDLPLYSAERDAKRPRGGPCLSHLSFKFGPESTLLLTAIYRSHSFIERALGNYLGLAALQSFVCRETSLKPGPLVSHSTYARIDTDGGWSPKEAISLIDGLRGAR